MMQKDGKIFVERNEEIEFTLDVNILLKNYADGKTDAIGIANYIAEIINDCLNCKSAKSNLSDENDRRSYNGTYFELIDRFTD